MVVLIEVVLLTLRTDTGWEEGEVLEGMGIVSVGAVGRTTVLVAVATSVERNTTLLVATGPPPEVHVTSIKYPPVRILFIP
jgi:hypothetical protein